MPALAESLKPSMNATMCPESGTQAEDLRLPALTKFVIERLMAKPRKINKLRSLDNAINSAFAVKPKGANFYQKVYAIVEQIPVGKVTTYGAIAETLGMKGSSRMVGQALNSVPKGEDIPAQRVINRLGALSGAHAFGGYEIMRRLLRKEGVTFKAELVNMEMHFWHPSELGEDAIAEIRGF
jgi:methylated-DNA-protein-cysteine methyltransferase related protein